MSVILTIDQTLGDNSLPDYPKRLIVRQSTRNLGRAMSTGLIKLFAHTSQSEALGALMSLRGRTTIYSPKRIFVHGD